MGAGSGESDGRSAPDPSGDWMRAALPTDAAAMYDVCVRTGAAGSDATGRYRTPTLLGDVFVGPYLALAPSFATVVDDGSGAEGYVLGVLDSIAFEAECETSWWPECRRRYEGVDAPAGSPDAWLLEWIRHPPRVPTIAAQYPSHLHIDVLPRWQCGGWGRRLIERLLMQLRSAGSVGVHLGVARSNVRAMGFYGHLGFGEVGGDASTALMARAL